MQRQKTAEADAKCVNVGQLKLRVKSKDGSAVVKVTWSVKVTSRLVKSKDGSTVRYALIFAKKNGPPFSIGTGTVRWYGTLQKLN